MPLNSDMKMIRSVNFSGSMLFSIPVGSLEESAITKILRKYSTRLQLLLHRVLMVLCKKDTSWIFPHDLPILLLLLCFHSSVAHKDWIWVNTYFCFLSTWALASSWGNTDLVHARDELSSGFTFRFLINFSGILNKLNLFEGRVLVNLQVCQIIRSKMNGCFHRRGHEHSPYQTQLF